ncbi:MAG: hypothetical protein BWX67_02195 [Thermotogae bacterium ADurb.Bin062]|nr:MAG: hypothetical protein BWX67_02195 [Thermotogota bacterium ADurb.Bin062]
MEQNIASFGFASRFHRHFVTIKPLAWKEFPACPRNIFPDLPNNGSLSNFRIRLVQVRMNQHILKIAGMFLPVHNSDPSGFTVVNLETPLLIHPTEPARAFPDGFRRVSTLFHVASFRKSRPVRCHGHLSAILIQRLLRAFASFAQGGGLFQLHNVSRLPVFAFRNKHNGHIVFHSERSCIYPEIVSIQTIFFPVDILYNVSGSVFPVRITLLYRKSSERIRLDEPILPVRAFYIRIEFRKGDLSLIPRQLLQSPIRFRLVDVHRRHLFHSGAIRNHTVQVFFCGNKKIGVHTFNELRVDALDKIGQIARFDARLHDPPIGFPLRVPMKSDPPLLQPLRSLLVGKGTRPVIHYAYFHIPYGYGHMISGRKFLRILERLRDGLRPVRIRNHALAQKPRHNRARRRFRLGVLVGPGASPPIPFLAIHAILRVVLFFLSPIRFHCGVENSVYLLAGTLMLSVLYYGSRCALGIFYSKFQLLLFRVERIHKPLRARLRPYQPALRRLQLVVPAFGLQLLEKHRIPRGVRHEIGELIGVVPAFFGQRIHFAPASELFDTPRLPLKSLPHDGIRRLLRGIRDNLDSESVRVGQIQLVFLSDDAPFALLQIGRTPRRVEMMQRDKPLLRVHPRSHHVGRTDEYPHIAGIYTSEQLGFLFSSIVIMDKLNLALRNTHFL